MNRNLILSLLILSMLLFTACDLFFVDEETQEIARSGTYSDCAALDTAEDKDRIEKCYSYVGKKQDDPEACNAATGSHRDSCYEDVAVDLGDETLCDEIASKYGKTDCFTEIAVDKKDPNLCTNLDSKERDNCYKDYSIDAGDFDICNEVSDDSISDLCYLHFAVEDNNLELCADLNSKSNRDDCYYQIASINTNPDYCDSIEKEALREQCKESIESMPDDEGCKYDSDCDDICEGEIRWKQGCDPNTGECSKTFDYDCTEEIESFSGTDFPKTCSDGSCVRNQAEIDATKAELVALKKEVSDNVKNLIAYRQEVNTMKLDANHKCLDGLSDVTNKFIIENAVKLASIASSGASYMKSGSSIVSKSTSIKYVGGNFKTITKPSYDFTTKFTSDAAGYFGDYTDKLVEKMGKLNQAPADAKPPIEDFIAFWCDYNNYLGEILDATGEQLDQQIAVATAIDEEIKALP